ncbi:MAG: AAA family ATPase [Caldilineaceae bacterium]
MLTIQLLGGFKLTYDGEPVPNLTKPRGKSLLAYLLLSQGTPQDRAHLAATFWPETSDRQARTNLRRELYQLRQTLPFFADYCQGDNQSVLWTASPDCTVDAVTFAQHLQTAAQATDSTVRKACYQTAIDLYQGELLPGLYDEWLLPQREALRQAFIQALEALTALLAAERAYGPATTLTQRLLQHDPLYEAGYTQLMELYALQNDRARALHTYHTCATILERELGVPPSDATEALYQRLLQADAGTIQQRIVTTTALQLVGRKTEWQKVLAAWRRTSQGRAHVMLIEGEAGIGKTRLGEELLEWANRQGIITARIRSYAAEGALAYAPVIEWLRSEPLRPNLAALAPAWRTEVARLLPELLPDFPGLPAPEPLTERWQRQRLFEALARAVTLDERPKVLLIDDLQWCDQETLEWLRYLLHFAPTAPLLVLGTVRTEEVEENDPLHALTRELRTSEQLTGVALSALTAVETTVLAAQVHGQALDDATASQLFTASEGNPLFVVEMVRAGLPDDQANESSPSAPRDLQLATSHLPPKVYAVIQHRLAQLSAEAQPLAELVAVVGRGFTYAELVAASNDDEATVVNGLDELWRRKIIREQGANAYDFSHDRIREAAYAGLSPMRRKLLHQRIARALKMVYSNETDAVSGELAFHSEQAGLTEESITWYQQAAQVAWARNAYHDVVNYQRSAIKQLSALPNSPENQRHEMMLQVEYANSMSAIVGMSARERRPALQRAKELAEALQDVNLLAKILARLGGAYRAIGEPQQIHICVEQAHRILEHVTDQQSRAELFASLGGASAHLGDFTQAWKMFRAALQIATTMAHTETARNGPVLCSFYFNLATALWVAGFPEQAWQLVQTSRSERDQWLEPFSRTNLMFQASILLRNLGYDMVLEEEATQMSVLGARYEMAMSKQSGAVFTGWLMAKRGELAQGIALARQGIDGYRRVGHGMFQTHRLAMLVEMLLWAKQLAEAEAILQEAFDVSERFEERFWDVELYRLQGDLLLAKGEADQAVENAYLRAIAVAQKQGAKSLELRASTALCRLWQRQGRRQEANQHLSAIYGWFTEGFDTQDLLEAKELLKKLA